jgi:hypothetical protein
MHFRLEHGSYRPCFTSNRKQAKAITDCPGCSTSLNLMVTHLKHYAARYVPVAALSSAMPVLSGESSLSFLLPASGRAADEISGLATS